MSHDVFRPHNEPARGLYDAFQAEAKNRKGRSVEVWTEAEAQAVWRTARDYAQQHGIEVPTMELIKRKERYARGSIDYGAKWAYGVAELLVKPATA